MLLAKTLLQVGDGATAEIELRKALAAGVPEDVVLPEIARAMVASGQSGNVIKEFVHTTLGSASADADLKTSLAAAYVSLGNTEQARTALTAAFQAQPGYAPAATLAARMAALGGDVPGSIKQLDEVLAREPGLEETSLLKAEILLQAMNQPDAAMDIARGVQRAHPLSIRAQTAVVNILLQQNKREQALAEYERLKKLAPTAAETLFLQAQFAFDKKDFKGSREITQKLLLAGPENVPVLLLAGAAEFQLKHFVIAEDLFSHALKNAPKLTMAHQLLAQTYLRMGHPDKAVNALQSLIDSPNADANSLALAGEAYLQAGDTQRSQAAYQRALGVAPGSVPVRTALAMAQLSTGDRGAAIRQLETIAEGQGGAQADLALVTARMQNHDLKGALQAIDQLAAKLPDQALPPTLKGRLLASQGDSKGAAASFDKALAIEPNYFAAIAGLAAVDLGANKPDQARSRFQALMKAEPRNYRPRLALAELDARLGKPDAVVMGDLRDAVKANPGEPEPHLALIGRLLAAGDGRGAEAAAQGATAALPDDEVILDALGRAQLAAGDVELALATFKKLARQEPRKAVYQLRLADAYRAGKSPSAEAGALRKALELDPESLPAQHGTALLALKEGRQQDAIGIARRIQTRLPKEAAGYELEGELEALSSHWAPATAAYRAALARNPSTELATKVYRCLLESGRAEEAERMAAEWQRENPKDVSFIFNRGDLASAAKDWPKAEAMYQAVLKKQPNNAMALNNLAWLLVAQHKPGAAALAERANALLPERAGLLDTLALALEAEGRVPAALDAQRRAVALSPTDPMMRLRLAQIYIKSGEKSAARKELEVVVRSSPGFAGQADAAALLKTL